MPHHLRNEDGDITLAEFHTDVVEYAKTWVNGTPRTPKADRNVFIAPRGSGKSTWLFAILPMWAAAYGYLNFIVAFSSKASQAERHLATFKGELRDNALLKQDFPELCKPKWDDIQHRPVGWNASKLHQQNGFILYATGIDHSNLGMKEGTRRPDMLLMDDIEKGESNYSTNGIRNTIGTVLDDIAPMNLWARMLIVGTTTMPNSMLDQFRQYGEGIRTADLDWIGKQEFKVHYYPALLPNEDGSERSLWPEQWPLKWLQGQRGLRDFEKNMQNKPLPLDSAYWRESDLALEEPQDGEYGNTVVSIDPAVSSGPRSDFTGIAVLSRSGPTVYVRHVEQVKLQPQALKERVAALVSEYGAGVVYCETNQGGMLWRELFSDLGAKYREVKQRQSKETRAGQALNYYQQGKVKHTKRFPVLETQLLNFPAVPNDDVLDAVVSGVLYFCQSKAGVTVKQYQYA